MNPTTRTVLHIDDDPDTRFLAKELLAEGQQERSDIVIQWLDAPGVEEAAGRYQDLQPDMILLDNRLGRANGVELLPRIQSIWKCPVWLVTGIADEPLRDQAVRNGARGVLSKEELLRGGRQIFSCLLRLMGF